jgi:hypothetical protein
MRLLALLVIALPAVAGAAPAINVDKAIAHDRALLASHATALCACKDMRCGEPHVDAYLRWKTDLDLMKDRDYDTYLATVASDPALTRTVAQLEDCNAALFMKPQAKSCKKRIASAAAKFAREAPRTYAPYRVLEFRLEKSDAPTGTIAAATVIPGRSWGFRAYVGPRSIARALGVEIAQVGDEWRTIPDERGVMMARTMGPVVAILEVQSERWGDFEPEGHPLTKLFLDKMRTAANKCVK